MKSYPPLSKVEMIERSMRCFMLGLGSLLPVVGIPLAVAALAQARRVKLGQGAMWNPAEKQLTVGRQLAKFTLGLTIIVVSIVSMILASS